MAITSVNHSIKWLQHLPLWLFICNKGNNICHNQIIPSFMVIPSATMVITSPIHQCGHSICYSGNNICQSPNKVVTTSTTVAFHLSQINILQWQQHLPQTFGITSASSIVATTPGIKTQLQLVVSKIFYKTYKHQYTWVFICKE